MSGIDLEDLRKNGGIIRLQGKEFWAPIPGTDGKYEISTRGRVRSYSLIGCKPGKQATPRILKGGIASNGYRTMRLGRKGQTITVHSMVLLVFVGPRPEGADASHLNGDRLDNRLENLVWESRAANCRRMIEHGTSCRGERSGHAQLTADAVRKIRCAASSPASLATLYGVHVGTIRDVLNRRTWRHI